MSDYSDSLVADVAKIVKTRWTRREGQVIPETGDIKLGNDRVELKAVFLYADLADSTELAVSNRETASEVYKAYLQGVSKLIRKNGGQIRSFDGDRVMGVFLDGAKNTAAVKCALQVNWFFKKALVPEFQSFYADLANFPFAQTVGVDNGDIHVARGGIRDHNDLIWVGRAPNVAAKLSSIRKHNISTWITEEVYKVMQDEVKTSSSGKSIWTKYKWNAGTVYGASGLHGSNWTWRPD